MRLHTAKRVTEIRVTLEVMRAMLVFIAACSSDYTAEVPPPKPPEITVGLASTRLGANCNEARPTTPEPPAKARRSPATFEPTEVKEPAQRIPCDQTAVQLSIRSPATAPATRVTMKRVELLDRDGTLLEVLPSHSPSRWGTDQFVPWNEYAVPGQTMAVGYKLRSPDWSKIPNANKRSFKMRVTVAVGDKVQTFEATAELRIEDTSNVVT